MKAGRGSGWLSLLLGVSLGLPTDRLGAQPDPPPFEAFLAEARRATAEMAVDFGWTGPVVLREQAGIEADGADGEGVDADANGISLNPEGIRSLVGDIDPYLRDAIRLIVAHEVWHFVELQHGHLAPGAADTEARRTYECRADLMAGRYVTLHPAMPPIAITSVDYSEAGMVARRLWRNDSPDHPTAAQRVTATHFGALSVMRDWPETTPDQRSDMDRLTGYRESESLDDWSRRACEMITHAGQEALASITAQDAVIEPHGDRSSFDIAFSNMSARHIEISTTIVAHLTRRSPADPTQRSFSSLYFPQRFVVAPCEKFHVTGTWPGVLPPFDAYLIYRPSDDDSLIAARFVPGGPARIRAFGTGLSAQEAAIGSVLQRLATDAPYSFAHHRSGGTTSYGQDRTFRATIAIPGPGDAITSIIVRSSGAASVSKSMSLPASMEETLQRFAQLRTMLHDIWPGVAISDSTRPPNQSPWFSMNVTRYAQIQMSILAAPDGSADRYIVFLTMEANPLGLFCD